MARILQHILNKEETNCEICGTSVKMISLGYTCIWRDVQDERTKDIRPEPKEREYAVFDSEIISNRLLELKNEKSQIINYVDKDEN